MIKKMNFFRFFRRSLTALPVFLLFSACNKLPPPSGTGKLVQVKIRAVSIAGGAQNEIVRASGGEQKRIVGGSIVQDLGNGMLAEITVEEDVSALRTGDTLLTNGAKFRVIVPDEGDHYFVAGHSYTIRLKRLPKFAGSNIYWNGSDLTFVPHDEYTNTKYQGACFRWGFRGLVVFCSLGLCRPVSHL
jgi:hypothetical protein